MHLTTILLPALLGLAPEGAAAAENPHRRAAALRNRAPKPAAARPAASAKRAAAADSPFLNANSEGE